MRRGRRPRLHSSRPPPQRGEPGLPAPTDLERFSQASPHQWLVAKTYLGTLQRALHFELEPLRQRNEARLRDWAESGSFVEVIDDAPEGARLTRIDGLTRESI